MEQNREVMVLPGSSLSYQYQGSHQLIKSGAALITSTDEVLFILKDQLKRINLTAPGCRIESDSSKLVNQSIGFDESSLMALIGAEPISVEALILNSGLTPAEVSSMLLILELDGRVAMSDDGGYINVS